MAAPANGRRDLPTFADRSHGTQSGAAEGSATLPCPAAGNGLLHRVPPIRLPPHYSKNATGPFHPHSSGAGRSCAASGKWWPSPLCPVRGSCCRRRGSPSWYAPVRVRPQSRHHPALHRQVAPGVGRVNRGCCRLVLSSMHDGGVIGTSTCRRDVHVGGTVVVSPAMGGFQSCAIMLLAVLREVLHGNYLRCAACGPHSRPEARSRVHHPRGLRRGGQRALRQPRRRRCRQHQGDA